MCASQQRVAARGHGNACALPSPSLAAKREGRIAERRMQPSRTLGGGSNARWQALTEGTCRTKRVQTAKAAELEEEPNRLSAQRHIARLARGVAVNAG